MTTFLKLLAFHFSAAIVCVEKQCSFLGKQFFHQLLFHGLHHRVHRVATAAFWRTFSHKGKNQPWLVRVGGARPPLLLHLPSPVKLQCTPQLSGQTGQTHQPCFISCKNMCSVACTQDSVHTNPEVIKHTSDMPKTWQIFCYMPRHFLILQYKLT